MTAALGRWGRGGGETIWGSWSLSGCSGSGRVADLVLNTVERATAVAGAPRRSARVHPRELPRASRDGGVRQSPQQRAIDIPWGNMLLPNGPNVGHNYGTLWREEAWAPVREP